MKDITGYTASVFGTAQRRYAAPARAFHWGMALLIGLIVPLGWIFAEFKTNGQPPTGFKGPWPGTPFGYASVHKTLGLLAFAIVAARLAYRAANPPPPLPGRMAAWEKGLAHASHWLLYLVLIVMPISGYIMSSAGKNPISIFGLFDFPKLPVAKDPYGEAAEQIHVFTQFVLYLLLVLHVGATAWHISVKRDGALDRMLPRQTEAD